jgi:hypothetical protein
VISEMMISECAGAQNECDRRVCVSDLDPGAREKNSGAYLDFVRIFD